MGELAFAYGATGEVLQVFQELSAGCAVDGSVNAGDAKEGLVGGVDDASTIWREMSPCRRRKVCFASVMMISLWT